MLDGLPTKIISEKYTFFIVFQVLKVVYKIQAPVHSFLV